MSDARRAVDARGDPDGDAALVLAPGVSPEDAAVCADRLAAADAALVVSLRRTPRDWQAARDAPLPPAGFVTTDPHPGSVSAVASPGDLTGIGIAVSEYLSDLPPDAAPAVCLDSLTTLLQFAETERAYRFLQVLCGRVRAAGGTVHCHADPAAHDDDALERLAGLFDGVLAVEA